MSTPDFEHHHAVSARSELDAEGLRAAWVRALAARLVQDGHAADDVAQDVWVAARHGAPEDEGSLRNWIVGVVRRLASKRARDAANRAAREREVARHEAVDPADEVLGRAESHRMLVDAVLALDEPYRSTLLLRYFDELTPNDIAKRQRVPVRTVKSRLARGLERLRARLDRDHAGDRSQWLAALAPLGGDVSLLPLTVGAMLVHTKLIVAAGLIVVVGSLAYWVAGDPDPDSDLATPVVTVQATDSAPKIALSTPGAEPLESEDRNAILPTKSLRPTPAIARDPERDLHGIVVDSRGVAIADARVRVFRRDASAHYQMPRVVDEHAPSLAETSSDAQGEFHLDVELGPALDLCVEYASYARCEIGMRHAGERVEVVLTRPARIHGRVTIESGAPAGAATILVGLIRNPRSWNSATTDANGEYAVEGIAAGDTQIFVSTTGAVEERTSPFLVEEGASIERDIVLARGVTARGHVVDAQTGTPITNAVVTASPWEDAPGVRTDDSGAYELLGVRGDSLSASVRARAPGYALGGGTASVVGGVIRVDIALGRGLAARGRVLDPDGRPLSGVEVRANGLPESGMYRDLCTTHSAADGTFELQRLSRQAAHDLRLEKAGFGGSVYAFPENERQVEFVEFGDLRMSRAGVITARAVDAHGKPLVEWCVRIWGGNADRLHFTEGRRDIDRRADMHETRTDDRGRFAIGDLSPGPYLVNISIKGCTASADRYVQLEDAQQLDIGDLVIDAGLAIHGIVVDPDGRPLSPATVEVYPESELNQRTTYTLTDTRGRFVLQGLGEGMYRLAIPLSFMDANVRDGLAQPEMHGVVPGGAELRIVAPRAVPISGRILGLDGRPLSNVYVDARRSAADPDGWPVDQTRTDLEGRFRLNVGDAVTYTLFAVSEHTFGGDATAHVAFARAYDIAAGSDGIVLRLENPR